MSKRHVLDDASLRTGLGVLAEHGARNGRLGPAAQIRGRGERRRRNARLAAAAAAGLVAVGILGGAAALVQQRPTGGQDLPVGTPPSGPAVSPSVTGGPAPAVTPKVDPSAVPGDGIPASREAVWLQATLTAGYPLLTRLPDGVVGTTTEQDAGDGALFALVPIRPGAEEYLLKTGVLGPAGEPECVTLAGDRVVIAACDVGRQQQIVTLRGHGPPFTVVVGGRALSVTQAEVRAVAPGSGTPLTFIVRGTAQDPFG